MLMRHKKKQVAPEKCRPKRESTVQLATLLTMVEEAEDARRVFTKCSGMHMPYVKWIIHQLCFRTWWVKAPFSCAEFVVPALTAGIPEAWENLVAAQGEMAVYASLFLSGYVGMFHGGFVAPNTTEELDFSGRNYRHQVTFGFLVGLSCGLFNILCAVFYRFAGSFLPRESDKLVVMWSMRWIPVLNVTIFGLGLAVGLTFVLVAGGDSIGNGDACMPDHSASYRHWYFEWVRNSYPVGKGLVHPLGEPVLNPWATAADAAGVARPDASYIPDQQVRINAHASFEAYNEFMQEHLGLHGDGCFGAMERGPIWLLYALIAMVAPLLFIRNPVVYWFRPWIGRKDPYDLAAVYAEFKMRAEIGQGMADKDDNNSGFVGPDDEGNYELGSAKNLTVPLSPPPSPPNPHDGPALIAGAGAGGAARPRWASTSDMLQAASEVCAGMEVTHIFNRHHNTALYHSMHLTFLQRLLCRPLHSRQRWRPRAGTA
jgi:hypothetical protein